MTRDVKFTPYGIPYILEFENVYVDPSRNSKESHQRDQRPAYHDSCPIAQSGTSKPRRSHYASSSSPSSSTSSFCYIESPPRAPRFPSFSLRSPSFLFRRKHHEISPQHCSPSHEPIPSHSSISSPLVQSGTPPHSKPLPPPPPAEPDVSGIHDIYIRFPPKDSFPHMNPKERLVHLQKTISAAVLEAGMNSSPGNATGLQEDSLDGENILHASGGRGYRTTDALFCGTYGQMMGALEGAGLSVTPCLEAGLSGRTRLGALFVARNDGANAIQLRKITLWG